MMTAYEVIQKYGWTQGRLGNYTDGFCINGALHYAYACDMHEQSKAFDKLSTTIGSQHLALWNDKHGRTVDEVLDVLNEAGV